MELSGYPPLKKNKLPKTHLIDDLAREIGLSEELTDLINELTIDYTFSRYPDISNSVPFEEYNEKTLKPVISSVYLIKF